MSKSDVTGLVNFIYDLGWKDSARAHSKFYQDASNFRGMEPAKLNKQYKKYMKKFHKKSITDAVAEVIAANFAKIKIDEDKK